MIAGSDKHCTVPHGHSGEDEGVTTHGESGQHQQQGQPDFPVSQVNISYKQYQHKIW